MPDVEMDLLRSLVDRFLEGTRLTPAERAEVSRIAQGMSSKDSAAAAEVAPETIRARRKRIYRKLGAASAREVISRLLALSLEGLAQGERPTARDLPSQAVPGASFPQQEATA